MSDIDILRHFSRPFDKLHAIYFLSNHHKVWWFNTYTTNTTITTFCGDFSTFLWLFQYFLMYELQNELTHFFGYILYYSTDELKAQDLKYICQIRDNDLIYITQLSQVPQKCGTFMLVPQVPQMWYKCGTKKRPHTFFGYFLYYAHNLTFDDLSRPPMTSNDL